VFGFAPEVSPGDRRRVVAVLAVAVLAVSSAGVLVRGLELAPPVIALWRAALVAALLAPWARRPPAQAWPGLLLTGALLAAHFTAWFASLQATTVMRSTVLVCTSPMWAAGFDWAAGGPRPDRRLVGGLGLAIGGVALLSTGSGEASWLGDGLALLGAALAGAYLVAGRRLRADIDNTSFTAFVCASAALWLVVPSIWTGAPMWGFDQRAWALLAVLALGPQLLGHGGFSYALGYLPAATVSGVLLLEPVGATLLAMALLGEVPGASAVVGAAVVFRGVSWAVGPRPGAQSASSASGGSGGV
jgi:drug/metabolite transporter (DMT)-like permease